MSEDIRAVLRRRRDYGLKRRHEQRLQRAEEKAMAAKAKRDPFEPWMNGFSYDQAFDGNTWTLTKGEDFDQSPSTVAGKLRAEYERRFGSLETKVEGDTVWVRRVAAPHT